MHLRLNSGTILVYILAFIVVASYMHNKGNGDSHARRGINLYTSSGDELEVLKELKLALKLGVREYDEATIYVYMGCAYGDLAMTDKAIKSHETAIEMNPRLHTPWSNLGLIYRERGETEMAKKCYRKALEIKPDYPEALNNLGLAVFCEGQIASSIDYYEKALKIDPSIAVARANLSLAYAAECRFNEAEESLSKAISLGYKNGDEIRSRINALRKEKGEK